ncbi:BGN_3a_G0047370.mRNA.1.CDS.1 [Saccharomyces cerevisiae]|nr:BGN_3a_G0047370.mRNA.1.CDS.1 [Saccharomyces cerevisiae]CAI7320788.1 BGN_3a_G0047370.mRNA.1.CDS.1 [Saccharomyces cerevisiae]
MLKFLLVTISSAVYLEVSVKRVSIAEALAAKGSIYCWDNATRGLDSSTALEFARAIRTMTNLLGTTALVTVYQASEKHL